MDNTKEPTQPHHYDSTKQKPREDDDDSGATETISAMETVGRESPKQQQWSKPRQAASPLHENDAEWTQVNAEQVDGSLKISSSSTPTEEQKVAGYAEAIAGKVMDKYNMRSVSSQNTLPQPQPVHFTPSHEQQPQQPPRSTRLCRHFLVGRCTYGNQCRFSHELSEIERMRRAQERSAHEHMARIAAEVMAMNGGASGYTPTGGGAATAGLMVRHSTAAATTTTPAGNGGGIVMREADPLTGTPAITTSAARMLQYPMGDHIPSISERQGLLQKQRNMILTAALNAEFEIHTINPNSQAIDLDEDGLKIYRGRVTLINMGESAEIFIKIYTERQLRRMLAKLEADPYINNGGLHYLVGESSIFWSMMRNWHITGTTTSSKWDQFLQAAAMNPGYVECMFYRTEVGCVANNCTFSHDSIAFSPKTPANMEISLNASSTRFEK